jgi:hypothetical protein
VDGAGPKGLVVFLHGDHSLGTPSDAAPMHAGSAPHPFVARLPRRLLASGALAVIGHVERIWTPAMWKPADLRQMQAFAESLERLLDGEPVGAALQPFDHWRGELGERLASLQEADRFGSADTLELVRLWAAHNDTRGYALLGDPAVRLPLDSSGRPSARFGRGS